MKKQLLFFSVFIFLFSCDNDTIVPNDNKISKYRIGYMDYYTGDSFFNKRVQSRNSVVHLEYNSDNRLIKRIGGMFPISVASGFRLNFTDHVYDEVSYLDNKIVIENKSSSPDISSNREIVTYVLDENNNIKQKIISINYENNLLSDTTNYFYDSENRLNTIKSINGISTLYFNDKNNLDSIVTIKNQIKVVEIFEKFDNAKNPLKHLNIFPETFKRSLSENNYSIYRKFGYNLSLGDEEVQRQINEWELQYDENGNVIF
ncbi:hypothetical protein [Aureibacter tunicatorum]|uniref:YD repeat-containing protein n=1 Tax=Aureibacter tunicatorum TaxID=866807 RepID=A0AAE3XSH0_9BACT|nr:hypothetical protein [Aureibacter tunicatorum]MDR6241199.1 hypothetical protein [Aureibacter tunicatorum]BDD03974.1 hypothetical protein AUTU_14570 [Aureibacter tunicatorum]